LLTIIKCIDMKSPFTLNSFVSTCIYAYVLVLIAVCNALDASAQKEEHIWIFGDKAGIDFSTGSPVALPDTTGLRAWAGTASVCDTGGQLLFYTDGDRIWNRDHGVMPDGSGILNTGALPPMPWSNACQSTCIVPFPDNSNRYYVFSLEPSGGGVGGRLFYSVVDMALDNGLGDIVPGQKRIYLDSPTLFFEKMAAVPGEHCDVWLMTMAAGVSNDRYRAFHITGAGIDSLPVISPAGATTSSYLPNGGFYMLGILKFSPDRSRLVNTSGVLIALPFFAKGTAEICDFDPATGIISNTVNLFTAAVPANDLPNYCYGAAFSPDGTKLYVSSDSIYQWDLSQANIIASRKGVIKNPLVKNELKTGPDGKIYIAHDLWGFLDRIEFPNLSGTACNAAHDVIPMLAGTKVRGGLPNAVAVAIPGTLVQNRAPDTTGCTLVAGGPLLELHVPYAGYAGYEWDDGTTDTVRTVYQAGAYWVYSYDRCNPRVDTFLVHGGYIPPVQISVDGYTLGTSGGYVSWQWYRDGAPIPGAADSVYTVDTNGVYSVKVTSADGCTDSSAYTVTNVSVTDHGMPAVGIYPNPAKDQVTIRADRLLHNASVRLVNIVGKVVGEQSGLTGSSFVYYIGDIPAGAYFVEVRKGVSVTRLKLLKE